ncbi:uncharacterized protein LOC125031295 [Penaeus chinensis]|uniref:uncharacterized protein LOC125031295 n=1 Tax=Penaeus chinensis TaxID=139456 RepID=UPI001FB65093|nr:uncharacterized protein LOC125031295 [Penaeus chinensis]
MRLLRLHVLCLGVCLSAAAGDEPQGCVITEMKNRPAKLNRDTLGKPLYLWPGSSLFMLSLILLLNNGTDEDTATVNLKNETQLLPKNWNKIEFSTTKINDTNFPTVSIPAVNETHIQRNCSNCSLKELQIKIEGSALITYNCSNNANPPALFADHYKEAGCTSGEMAPETCTSCNAWKYSLLLLPICFLSILRNIWTLVKHRRRSAGETARRQEDNLPLVFLGAQNVSLVSHGAQDLPPPVPPRFLESPAGGAVRRERGMREYHDATQSTESENVYEEVPEGAIKASISVESVNSIYGTVP